MQKLNANQLKLIAIIAMIIDHIAWGFVDDYSILGQIMHIFGRLTIPIMCYFVAEGFIHTSNLKKYIMRMAAFAAISYIPYVLYLKHGYFRFDFIFDLLLSLLFLSVWEKTNYNKKIKILTTIIICLVSCIFSGWPLFPIILVANFYYNRKNKKKQMLWFVIITIVLTVLSTISLITPIGWLGDTTVPVWGKLYFMGFLLAIPLLQSYSGKLGEMKQMKWVFYLIYPLHLLTLYFIQESTTLEIFIVMSIVVIILICIMIVRCLMEVPSKPQIFFVLSSIGFGIFVLGILLELGMSNSIEGAMATLKLQYTGQIILFISLLLFVASFVDIYIPKVVILAQGVVGSIDLIACLTMEYHSYFYINPSISYSGEYPMIQKSSGLFFILHYVDMAAILLGILIMCIVKYVKGNDIDKKRVRFLLIGLFVSVAEVILKGLGVFGTYNPISFALFILLALMFMAFFRYGYFDTVEAATANVLNQGNEGLIVVDSGNRIISINSLIHSIFPNVQEREKITNYENLLPYINNEKTKLEINEKIFDIRNESLKNKQGYEQGYMLWFVDMTEHLKYLQTLENYQEELKKEVKKQANALKIQDEKIMNMQKEVIISIANIIESRDGTTGEHVKRTSNYVSLLIEQMKINNVYTERLTTSFVNYICSAAPMHDIGKIAIPDSVLQKPGKLEIEEIQIMNMHTIEGGKIIESTMNEIEDTDYVKIAVNVAMYHHEKWNGKGYPKGLKETEIPLEARIMAVADVFDALTSERQYKKAISVDKAYKIMQEEMKNQFDPKIIKVFLDSKEEFRKLLETFEEG